MVVHRASIGAPGRFLLPVRSRWSVDRRPSVLGRHGMPGILRTVARVANRHNRRPLGWRERPQRIVLDARDGAARSSKPPVRIFVGTEPAQHRAERVFVWSVEQARDPSRVYEIYLMSDLVGFDRRRWLTGFTNYRFAIP